MENILIKKCFSVLMTQMYVKYFTWKIIMWKILLFLILNERITYFRIEIRAYENHRRNNKNKIQRR